MHVGGADDFRIILCIHSDHSVNQNPRCNNEKLTCLSLPSQLRPNRLLRGGSRHLLAVHRVRHPADARGQAQARPQPGGVHLRRAQPLPGHRQPVPLPPADLWKFKVITTMNISSKFGTF